MIKNYLIEFLAKSIEYIIGRYRYHKDNTYFLVNDDEIYEEIAKELLDSIKK